MTEGLVFGSVAGAIAGWALAEWWRDDSGRTAWARAAWTAGAVLMTVHSAAAFVLLYGGSHATAVAETARQTAALTGLESGVGIYVNYAFLAVWIVDAAWWWMAPSSYLSRPRTLSALVRAFFLFMFVNGAVLFADGLMRILGGIAVATTTSAWIRRLRRRQPRRASAIG